MWWTFSLPVEWGSLGIFLHTMSSSTWLLNIRSHDMRITKLCINLLRFTLWMHVWYDVWTHVAFILTYLRLRLALCTILNAKPGAFVVLLGVVCSSWTVVNAGTSRRSVCHPLGSEDRDYVKAANIMISRFFCCKEFQWTSNFNYWCVLWLVFMHIFFWCLFRSTTQPQIAKGLHLDLADWEPGRGVVRRATFIVIVKMASKDVGLVWNLPSIWAIYIQFDLKFSGFFQTLNLKNTHCNIL